MQPVFYNLALQSNKQRFSHLQKRIGSLLICDEYEDQLKELFLSRNPALRFSPQQIPVQLKEWKKTYLQSQSAKETGRWVYIPWRSAVVHVLAQDDYYELFTSRNRNLITVVEQQKFRTCLIGIAGLSVGNSIAVTLALEGAEHMRLADYDVLSLSNLNRIRGSITYLGYSKAQMTAHQMHEINPYIQVTLVRKRMDTLALMQKFFLHSHKLDVVVDEMDDIQAKILLRRVARRLRVPVVSAADVGENAVIDVERYDTDADYVPFHGRIGNTPEKAVQNIEQFSDTLDIMNTIVGKEYIPARMIQSLSQIGKTLYTWPQLGGAAAVGGAAVAYVVRRIVTGLPMQSGKYRMPIDVIGR